MTDLIISALFIFGIGMLIRHFVRKSRARKQASAAPPQVSAATAAPPAASAFCPQCGTPVTTGSTFCGNCGAKLQ